MLPAVIAPKRPPGDEFPHKLDRADQFRRYRKLMQPAPDMPARSLPATPDELGRDVGNVFKCMPQRRSSTYADISPQTNGPVAELLNILRAAQTLLPVAAMKSQILGHTGMYG